MVLNTDQPKLDTDTSFFPGRATHKEKPASYPAPMGTMLLGGALPSPEF